jgi:ribonuclease HII
MFYPNLHHERKLKRRGFKAVVGLDEAGRGSWAGPIVAGAVILNQKIRITGIKDSKLLRLPDRQELFKKITSSALAWSYGLASEKEIDKLGVVEANVLAMKRAIDKLPFKPDYLLIDALNIDHKKIPALAINHADHKITSVAAASIIAKVVRDQIMDELDEKFPQYGFKHHKGYGTNHHHQMLMQYGVSDLHRKTFQPMKYLIND